MRRLSSEQVLELHDALLREFGGTAGVRDQGLLDSALNTPFAIFRVDIGASGIIKERYLSIYRHNVYS